MGKNFSEELGEWLSRKNRTQRDRNLVAFLAVLDDVKDGLKTGYSAKSVWAYLLESKRIEFGYDTFLNYANRFIDSEQRDQVATKCQTASKPLAPDIAPNRTASTAAKAIKSEVQAKFVFNPVPPEDKELF